MSEARRTGATGGPHPRRDDRIAEADHLVCADVGVWLRRGLVGGSVGDRWPYVVGGILLAGPLVCGTSQAVNDWFDREVDAINEPNRVIPSGRMPGRWGLFVAIANTVLSLAGRVLAWRVGLRRGYARAGARLGLQCAAVAAEAQRLVWSRGGRSLL